MTYQPIRGGARRDVAILINGGLAGRLDARDDSCTYGHGDGRRGRGEGGGQRSSQREELWRAHEGPLQRTFHEKCSKYPFIRNGYELENPGKKYYTFVFQDDHWKNGGLGDRVGGLLTAIATSLRTDRQLLVTSSNGFHDLFRPYHPPDNRDNEQVEILSIIKVEAVDRVGSRLV